MDKVLFVGVGETGSLFVKKVNEELEKINAENGPQVDSVCFVPSQPCRTLLDTNIDQYGLNDMDGARGNGFTSRRSPKEYKEVAEVLKEDIRAILQSYLDSKHT